MDVGARIGAESFPVLADGKIFVGNDGGSFFIIRPQADRGEVLSKVELPNSTNSCCGSEGTPEQILGNAAVSRGRISSCRVMRSTRSEQSRPHPTGLPPRRSPSLEAATPRLQVSPTELSLEPGQTVKLRARSFDASGRFLREEAVVA